MADIEAMIEAQELRFLQSWMHRDAGAIRDIAARDFMMMVGSNPPELLDRPSFVAAAEDGFRCTGFRLGQAFVRRHGRCAWYAAGAKLDLELGRTEWTGDFMLTGLWRKSRFKGWKLAEHSVSQTSKDERFTQAVRSLQMWT
uniref:nuclear transport factor 2 family protein n=1 Tax=uncultured Erythrobacter sp. TaxID=263913 RepID=UPI0026357144|nr:nuclear transport factor 2 family protein [uncultured Erythrobacter sp.]